MEQQLPLDKDVLMARQPIVNSNKQTVAYELLYRSNNKNAAAINFSGSQATIEVLLNAYTSVYQSDKLRRMPAFINMTYSLLVDNNLPVLPTNQIVLEILEDVKVDETLIKSVTALHRKGYKLALDDFIYDDKYIPLLKLAHIIKVDVLEMSPEEVTAQVAKLKPYKVTLLAEKIETEEMLQHCRRLGFKLFQGYFLSKPVIVKGSKVKPSQASLLQIVQALQDPDVDAKLIEKLVLKDPLFTYKLLRIVNSSSHGLVRQIQSVMEAINILGMVEVKKWALIVAMLGNNDKPDELARQLLIRGRMCERLAQYIGEKDAPSYMIAGMMSGINALLDIEIEELLAQVPLTEEINAAIAQGNGTMGEILSNTIHFKHGNWDRLSGSLKPQVYNNVYRESLNWAAELTSKFDD